MWALLHCSSLLSALRTAVTAQSTIDHTLQLHLQGRTGDTHAREREKGRGGIGSLVPRRTSAVWPCACRYTGTPCPVERSLAAVVRMRCSVCVRQKRTKRKRKELTNHVCLSHFGSSRPCTEYDVDMRKLRQTSKTPPIDNTSAPVDEICKSAKLKLHCRRACLLGCNGALS